MVYLSTLEKSFALWKQKRQTAPMRSQLLWSLLLTPLCADQTYNLSHFAKGVFAEQRGEKEEARAIYESVLAKDPESYPLVTKVVALQSREDIPAASATLRSFAKKHRKHLAAQLHYSAFLRQHAPHDAIAREAALETLELANRNFPETDVVFSPLINLYENLERREDSIRLLEEQLSSANEDPNHWLALAPIIDTLYPRDDPQHGQKLARVMEKVSEYGLHQENIARRVSEYHRENGKLAEAIETLRRHLELTPYSHSLRTRMGLLQLSNKEETAGELTLLDVIAIDPDQSLAHGSLSKLYLKKEQPRKALFHRAEVLRISGGTPAQAIEVANEYLDLDEPHPARLLLEKFRFDYPDEAGIHARLAIATLRDGLTQEAARLFRQAEALAEASKNPADEQYLDADFQIEFAQSLVEANDLESAETRLRQAAQGLDLDTQPEKYARAVTKLAKLWIEQGKNEAPAKALLQRALSLDPNNEEAAELLK
ncbi:hypothetical protein GCM10007100_11670 [Roseibacillus persicicus]|uniref:Tetratricopeptide repeat protein n=2 Tax=Roseibacillus persicicus TaxID=454148 RepID=A0A918TJD1_9BACT|nr:hypothetical protein GCM10007100_11670 [Roseibacillus persicicus]